MPISGGLVAEPISLYMGSIEMLLEADEGFADGCDAPLRDLIDLIE